MRLLAYGGTAYSERCQIGRRLLLRGGRARTRAREGEAEERKHPLCHLPRFFLRESRSRLR